MIGGCLDTEFAKDSLRFMESVRQGQIIILVSEVVVREILQAPPRVQDILFSMPAQCVERVTLTTEILALRNEYMAARIVGTQSTDDATHVAAATVARADAIVSWNFAHIVRLDKMKAYNRVNLLNGYGILTIITPKEVHFDEPGKEKGF